MELYGVKIINGKLTSEAVFFKLRDIFFIDMWSPKKNYSVPCFHTREGLICGFLTLEAIRDGFKPHGFLALDSTNVTNPENILYVTEEAKRLYAHYENGEYSSVSKANKRIVSHLLRK